MFSRGKSWKQVKVVKIPMPKADLFLGIFEAIPGTLKRFEEGPLHFLHEAWLGLFFSRETWFKLLIIRDSWFTVNPLLPKSDS